MKKIICKLWLSGILTLMLFAIVFTASAEAGGDFATAQEINVNEVYTDNIISSDDVDYYEFTLASAGNVYIEFSRENLFDAGEYWTAVILDSNSNSITEYSFSGNETKTITYRVGLAAGTYFLRMRCGDLDYYYKRHSDIDYKFNVKYTKSNYCEKENNEEYSSATKIVLNNKYSASIKNSGDIDFYKFTLTADGYVYLDFERSNLFDAGEYWTAVIFDFNSNSIAEYSFSGNETKTTTYKVGLASGTYFLRIRCGDLDYYYKRYSTVDYKFNVKYAKSDCWEKENNENFTTATEVALNKKQGASLNSAGDVDFYKFTLKETTNLTLKFFENVDADSQEYYTVALYDSATNEITYFSVFGNSSTTKQNVTLNKGTYYIRIRCGAWDNFYKNHSTNDYGIFVGYTEPGKPSKITTSASTSSIKLSWNKVSGATGYRIYKYNTKTKKYETLKTLSGTSYTIKNLNPGTIYKFKIKAYKKVNGETIWGDASSAISVTTKLAVPKGIKTVQSTKAIKLTWSKVTGADGYRVYQYNSKTKTWDKIKTTTATSYKVQKLKAGTTYKFRIKAYKKDDGTIWGTATPTITVATKPATPKITKLTTTKGKAALAWSNIAGENGYQVYVSTKKDSGFKKLGTYKADIVKASKSKLISGKTYYFKVRAYKTVGNAKVYSAWSAVKSIKIK